MHRHQRLNRAQAVLLAFVVMGLIALFDPTDWRPIELFGSLLTLAIAGEFFAMRAGSVKVSPSFLAIGLAMTLLGPVPASVIAVVAMLGPSLVARTPRHLLLNNVVTFATFPLVGGWLIEAIAEPIPTAGADFGVAALVFAVYLLVNCLNFSMIVGYLCVRDGGNLVTEARRLYLPVLPWEAATAGVTAATVIAYEELGVAAVGVLALMLFTYQLLLKAVVEAERQRDELKEQMGELIELHHGVLQVMMETLSLRDRGTARHAAAVARFARATAEAAGLSERDQELAHTAGLLHDIGKFAFTDSVLTAKTLSDEDWKMIRRHPSEGARIVRRVKGFDAVADVIEAHHERTDGTGYPFGLSGEQVPVVARIIAIADVFDVLTARGTYRAPISREEAIAELRSSAGTQFDTALVEEFVGVVERGVGFAHGDDADFETELSRSPRFVPGWARGASALA